MKKIISAIFIVFIAINGYSRSFDDIINQVRLNIKDNGPTSNEYRYSQSDMVRAANFVHDEVCRETGIPETVYSTTTSPGVAEYDLPSDIIGKPTRVAYYNSSATSTFKRLDMFTIGGLDTDNENWENESSGLPKEYYLRADKIGLNPAPSASYSTTTWNTLKVYYVADPADINTSTTSLATEPFEGYPQYQSYSNVIVAGIEAFLTKRGYDIYYNLIKNMSQRSDEKYDLFIDRDPDRRRY